MIGLIIVNYGLLACDRKSSQKSDTQFTVPDELKRSFVLADHLTSKFSSVGDNFKIAAVDEHGDLVKIDTIKNLRIYRNGEIVEGVEKIGHYAQVAGGIETGRNTFVAKGELSDTMLLATYEIWGGDQSLAIKVVDDEGKGIPGIEVSTGPTETPEVAITKLTDDNGEIKLEMVPDVSLIVSAQNQSGKRFATSAIVGSQGHIELPLRKMQKASEIDNNSFSKGLKGWELSNKDAVDLDVLENRGSFLSEDSLSVSPRRSFHNLQSLPESPAAVRTLTVHTLGQGAQWARRTFKIPKKQKKVIIKYQFYTSEYPAYLGTKYNDRYQVSLRVKDKLGQRNRVEGSSLNEIGAAGFDSSSKTIWRSLEVAVSSPGIVEVDIMVANVGDEAFDSSLTIQAIGLEKDKQTDEMEQCRKMYADNPCAFYRSCVETSLRCGPDGYAIGYGEKYCKAFSLIDEGLSPKAIKWRDSTRTCLQQRLAKSIDAADDVTCSTVRSMAFNKHSECYTQDPDSICYLTGSDGFTILTTVDTAEILTIESAKQIEQTASICIDKLSQHPGRSSDETIKSTFNYWQKIKVKFD